MEQMCEENFETDEERERTRLIKISFLDQADLLVIGLLQAITWLGHDNFFKFGGIRWPLFYIVDCRGVVQLGI